MKGKWYLIVLFLVMTLGIIIMFGMQHEGVHAAIDTAYGNCSTETIYACGMYTQPSNCTFHTMADYDNYRYLNAMNEIFGYNVSGIMMAIIFGCFLIAFAIMVK